MFLPPDYFYDTDGRDSATVAASPTEVLPLSDPIFPLSFSSLFPVSSEPPEPDSATASFPLSGVPESLRASLKSVGAEGTESTETAAIRPGR